MIVMTWDTDNPPNVVVTVRVPVEAPLVIDSIPLLALIDTPDRAVIV